MHFKRWITAIIGVPLLVLLVSRGGPLLFALFISTVCIIALQEYYRIAMAKTESGSSRLIPNLAYIAGPALIWSAHNNWTGVMVVIIVMDLIVCAAISVFQFKSNPSVQEFVAKQMVAIVYIALFLSHLVFIRNTTDGILWVFMLIGVVFAGDTGAYYVGTYFGRRKLCPSISPGKTVEGALGGLAANIIAGLIFLCLSSMMLSWVKAVLLFVAIGVCGQIGDLFESQLKRVANIKDSGIILPGHGGILDRIDALLFAAPVTYWFIIYSCS
jgi:phosphatidate cytidylyltransferase